MNMCKERRSGSHSSLKRRMDSGSGKNEKFYGSIFDLLAQFSKLLLLSELIPVL